MVLVLIALFAIILIILVSFTYPFVYTFDSINKKLLSNNFNLFAFAVSNIKKNDWVKKRFEDVISFGVSRDSLRRVLVSTVTIAIALYLAINRDEILNSTANFFKGLLGNFPLQEADVSYSTIVYYLFLLFWVIYLTYHYAKINRSGTERMQDAINDIKSAVYKVPNLNSFEEYSVLGKTMIASDRKFNFKNFQNYQIEDHELQIRKYLKLVCQFVSSFMNADISDFSANVMLLYTPRMKRDFENLAKAKSQKYWVYKSVNDFNSLESVFFTDSKLCFPQISKDDLKIFIPFVDEDYFDGHQIPGACTAFIEGEHFISDTSNIDHDFQNMPLEVLNEAKEYFKSRQEAYKSFISFSLQNYSPEQNMSYGVGALNINFKKDNIGIEKSYFTTLSGLLSPIILIFSDYIEKYYYKFNNELVERNFLD